MSETVDTVECLVTTDRMRSRVRIGDERRMLDAAEVEALIWSLAACRADMLPRRTTFLFTGSRISLGATVRTTTDADGREITAIMHPGIGWVGAVTTRGIEGGGAGTGPASDRLGQRAHPSRPRRRSRGRGASDAIGTPPVDGC